jgi:hypothetical protein
MEQDRDDTDFRKVANPYEHRETGCLFCELPAERLLVENRLAVAILDQFPVTAWHLLVIPISHKYNYTFI